MQQQAATKRTEFLWMHIQLLWLTKNAIVNDIWNESYVNCRNEMKWNEEMIVAVNAIYAIFIHLPKVEINYKL